jgi:uncharacterized protein with HEPN domain
MEERVVQRLKDIIEAIERIDSLLTEVSYDQMLVDDHMRAAFERYLEIVSEASRHVPEEFKNRTPGIPWRNVADIGNHIRHAYSRIDPEILWNTYESGRLAELEAICRQFLAEIT